MTASQILDLPGRDALDELDLMRNLEHLVAVDRLKAVARLLEEYGTTTVEPADVAGGGSRAGRERAVRLGGEGTPLVAEFLPALAGGRLEVSSWASARLCADVLDLVHRLPLVWASLSDYLAKASCARLVAARTRHLSHTQAGQVDARVVESCDGRLSFGRFLAVLDGVITDVDAEAVAAREREAATEQFAKATQSTVHGMRGFYVRAPFPVIARLDATVTHLADAVEALGHGGTLDERRVLAVLIMANPAQAVALLDAYHRANRANSANSADRVSTGSTPGGDGLDDGHGVSTSSTPGGDGPGDGYGVSTGSITGGDGLDDGHGVSTSSLAGARSGSTTGADGPDDAADDCVESCGNAPAGVRVDLEKLLPQVVLHVHLSEAAVRTGTGVARVEGLGYPSEPVTAAWVRSWLGPRARFVVKPVFVPEAQTPVDAYEVPARHREAVHLMTPADCFPWAANTTRHVQIDHTIPYDKHGPPGQSRVGNYGPMTTLHHRIKTHGGWQCTQPFPGIYLWRDPTGATYLVDHTGTRRLHDTA